MTFARSHYITGSARSGSFPFNLRLELLIFSIGERLTPVKFELIGLAVGTKLFERRRKGVANLANLTLMRKDEFAFRRITLVSRKLVDVERQIFSVSDKTKIEFLRVAIPFEEVLFFV